MIRAVPIVEGYGDVAAIPTLLAKIGQVAGQAIVSDKPIRAGEWGALRAKGALPKFLELAHSRNQDIILVILDLDDGCPVEQRLVIDQIILEWKNGRNIEAKAIF